MPPVSRTGGFCAMDIRSKVLYLWRMASFPFPRRLGGEWLRLNGAPQIYRCEPSWSWAPAPLTDYDLWCVLDGTGELLCNGTRYELSPDFCFVFPPSARIEARQDPQHRLRVFAAHFDFVQTAPVVLPTTGQRIRDGAFVAALARQSEAAWRGGDDFGRRRATCLVAQLLLYLWVEAQRPIRVGDSRTLAVIRAVREDPGQYWSVTALAKQAGLSRSQFSRHLTAAVRTSPEQFLIQARVDRAKYLLRETDMTIGQIADALGYRDAYYFSRQFARVTGMTASAFRK